MVTEYIKFFNNKFKFFSNQIKYFSVNFGLCSGPQLQLFQGWVSDFFFCHTKKCVRQRRARKFLTIIVACNEEDMAAAVSIGAAGEKFF